jgi:hypothetical protein
MRTFLTLFFACLQIIVLAQINGARSDAMGDLKLGLSDLFSAINNQSMLPEIRTISAGINVQNQYLLKNLITAALPVAIPVGK